MSKQLSLSVFLSPNTGLGQDYQGKQQNNHPRGDGVQPRGN